MPARWDGDTRGRGVGDAAALVPGAEQLIAAFKDSAWVAEEPDVHLGPHVEAWCAQDQRLGLTLASVDARNAFVLELDWRGDSGQLAQARAAVFALIGSFAESATYVRQRRVENDGADARRILQFEVGTGELSPDTRFDSHGHVVVINVAGVF